MMNVSSPIFRPQDTENSETCPEDHTHTGAGAQAQGCTPAALQSHLADEDHGEAGEEGVDETQPRLLRPRRGPARPRRVHEHLRKKDNIWEGGVQR